jgi:hypothetical protein
MGWKLEKRERYALIEQDTEDPQKHKGTFFIGPHHVKHHYTNEFVEFSHVTAPNFASGKDCRVFAQNSHVAIEVYDYYTKLFNPDYETVSVYDERFVVQYLFKTMPEETWKDVGAWNPTIQVIPLDDGVEIKKTFDTNYGTASLEVSHIIRTGAFLKHNIKFINKTVDVKTFRVVMKLAGITSAKCTHKDGTEEITAEKSIGAKPFFFIGESEQNLKLTEYLWSLGTFNETTEEWTPDKLKGIVFDVHAQGCKADIIIGNYTLALNESLLIDPTTTTYTVGASSDDCFVIQSNSTFNAASTNHPCGDYDVTYYDYEGGMRWTVDIPQGATINSAYLKLVAISLLGSIPTTIIKGEDADDPVTFSNLANYNGRTRTAQSVSWIPSAWTAGITYTSDNISSIIQAIVNRAGFGTHLVLFWSHALGWGGVQCRIYGASWDHAIYDPPKLEVTWTSGAPPPTAGILVQVI